jgi:hypothetical protein
MFSDLRTVTIHMSELTGGGSTHLFTWTLEKAFVTKFTPSNLDAEAENDVAIEEVELTYQAFSMESHVFDTRIGAIVEGIVTQAVGAAMTNG